MAKREAFGTGKPHQAAVATWVRSRLADRNGGRFADGTEAGAVPQLGCLLADGVGMGKTWEALAATALILDKEYRPKNKGYKRRKKAHVLILVPPALVDKWSSELQDPGPASFSARLSTWAGRAAGRGFILQTLSGGGCFEIARRADLDHLPKGRVKHGRYILPAGTYVCNWNVFLGQISSGRDRVNALRRQRWDMIIVDEAHHRRARQALDKFHYWAHTALLTATPFQLDMTELHGLTLHLVDDRKHVRVHKVLARGSVRDFAKAADAAFDGATLPTKEQRESAEKVLGQLVACSRTGPQKRVYHVISGAYPAHRIPPPTSLEESDLPAVYAQTIDASSAFNEWYMEKRLALAHAETPARQPYVALELRKLLSVTRAPAPTAPRLAALRSWARLQFAEDLRQSLADGLPRKMLVFTHLKTNVAAQIKNELAEAFQDAWREAAATPEWRRAEVRAASFVKSILADVRREASNPDVLKALLRLEKRLADSPFFALFARKGFRERVRQVLLRHADLDRRALKVSGNEHAWYASQAKATKRRHVAFCKALADAPIAATYTGDDSRRRRDAVAEAFKSPLAPWILVATNVGSEGIDLHTYSRHLVHFDLEWNPARMEQREGRIDRLGRALKEPARVYYLLVKDTYDERMFHQLIARQRWHGVLLGRKALQLAKDDTEAPLTSRRTATSMALNLDPAGRRAK